jgi:multicomponent Na+:H+ antiporter subunit A
LETLLPLLLALIAAPAAMLAGTLQRSLVALVGSAFTMLAFLATVFVWHGSGGSVDFAWAPAWDLRFAVSLDGLAALYALLATGVGFLVLVYSSSYLPLHLEHEGRPESEKTRFYGFMLLFMGSMVGLAMAQDLILLFGFGDLNCDRFLLSDWVRPPRRGRPGLGAHGAPRDRCNGRFSLDSTLSQAKVVSSTYRTSLSIFRL